MCPNVGIIKVLHNKTLMFIMFTGDWGIKLINHIFSTYYTLTSHTEIRDTKNVYLASYYMEALYTIVTDTFL